LSFFTKIKELFDAPESAPTHGDWFYHTKLFSKKIVFFYKHIIKEAEINKAIKTGEPIVPPDLSFNITTSEVIDKWGMPRCTFTNEKEDGNIQIFFYRKNHVYENTLFQLQFFNDKLFFAGIEVGKSMMDETNKIKMLGSLLPNFITENFKEVNQVPIWADTNNNYLLIEDEVNLNICYLSGLFANEKITILEDGIKIIPTSQRA
jgi:hypothetical protein